MPNSRLRRNSPLGRAIQLMKERKARDYLVSRSLGSTFEELAAMRCNYSKRINYLARLGDT